MIVSQSRCELIQESDEVSKEPSRSFLKYDVESEVKQISDGI